MAIYHLKVSILSRGGVGRSAVAAAAYRAGLALEDDRYGLTHDYTAKSNVRDHFIQLALRDGSVPDDSPQGRLMQENLGNSGGLWNEVEALEVRKDARLAREITVALPCELTPEQQKDLVRDFVENSVNARGWIADVSIHEADKRGDQRNVHAHILIPDRQVGTNYQWETKKNRELNRKEVVADIRKEWSAIANEHLTQANLEARIDHRSLRDRGIERPPNIHMGPAITNMIRSGDPEKVQRAMGILAERQELRDRSEGWARDAQGWDKRESESLSQTAKIAAEAERISQSYIPNLGRAAAVKHLVQSAENNAKRAVKPFLQAERAAYEARQSAWNEKHGPELSRLNEQLAKEQQLLKDEKAPLRHRLRMQSWREEQQQKVDEIKEQRDQLLSTQPKKPDYWLAEHLAREHSPAVHLAQKLAETIHENKEELLQEHPNEVIDQAQIDWEQEQREREEAEQRRQADILRQEQERARQREEIAERNRKYQEQQELERRQQEAQRRQQDRRRSGPGRGIDRGGR